MSHSEICLACEANRPCCHISTGAFVAPCTHNRYCGRWILVASDPNVICITNMSQTQHLLFNITAYLYPRGVAVFKSLQHTQTELERHTDTHSHREIPMGAMESSQACNLKISTEGMFTPSSVRRFIPLFSLSVHRLYLPHFLPLPALIQEQMLSLSKVNITKWKWTCSVCWRCVCGVQVVFCVV